MSGSAAEDGGIPAKGQWRGGVKAQRVVQLLGGLILVTVGVLWTLQGLGMVGGSVMSGVTLWAIVGPIVAAIGVYLTTRARR